MSVANEETVRLAAKAQGARAGRWRVVVVGEAGSSSFALPADGTVIVGRGDEAQVRLDDTAASRKHAQLVVSGGAVTLIDLGSANGTTVRGRKLAAHEQVALGEGDAVELGTSLLVLQPDELSASTRPWNLFTHQRFLELAAEAKPPFALVRLQVLGPPGLAQEVLSAELSPHDLVASFGPGQFEILAPGRQPEPGKQLMEKLSAKLVARGARVRAGLACAPRDGVDPDVLMAACARPASAPQAGFVVRDDAMAALYRLVDRIAPSSINVLLLGETGVGKEVLASELHRRSKRAPVGRSCGSTARRSPSRCSRASCSATRRAPSPGRSSRRPACSSRPQGGTVLPRRGGRAAARRSRPSCCACSRSAR